MKTLISLIAAGAVLALTAPAFAADTVTIAGEAKCAKCALHEGKECQTVIQTEENGKTITYYLADNKEAKGFHDNVCQKAQKVTATGTVKEKDGKKILTVTKIELAK